jgi:predicted small lipoprotein YifL
MKKLITFTIALSIVCTLSACATTAPEALPADAATAATLGVHSREALPAELPQAEFQSDVDDGTAVTDHESILQNLGSLADSGGWTDPCDISTDDLLIWFGSRAFQSFGGDMSHYEIEGRDGLFFPCFVFEGEVSRCFGINASSLRDDPAYDAETKTYASPVEMFESSNAKYEITRVEIEGGHDVVYFNLSIDGVDIGERALTIDASSNVFSSYT